MEFHEKLQILRKEKGLTQEELAEILFVSRAAVSKWESGRGYPNIDSLKAIAKYFSVSIDDLLSGNEILTIAEEDVIRKKAHFCDLFFGCLDCSFAMFFFLPIFGEGSQGTVLNVSLLQLSALQPWLKGFYLTAVFLMILVGILTLALQTLERGFWARQKRRLSLLCNIAVTFVFILSRQPYASAFSFIFLLIKVLLLAKKPRYET